MRGWDEKGEEGKGGGGKGEGGRGRGEGEGAGRGRGDCKRRADTRVGKCAYINSRTTIITNPAKKTKKA